MNETEQKQKLMRLSTAGIFFAVMLAVLGYLVYRALFVMNGEFDTTARIQMPLAILVMLISAACFELIRRGQTVPGTIILFALTLGSPLAASFMIEGGGLASGIYIALASTVMIVWVLPKSLTRGAAIFSIISIVAIIFVEIINPPFRADASIVPNYPVLVAVLTGLIIFPLFAIQMWMSGRLRNRIIALMIVVLLPIQVIFSYFNVQAQQQDLEQSLLERVKSIAVVGATTIGKSLEDAIADGKLTNEQAFDQNYVKFFEFDPANYPELTDDPRIYDKYRTAYDAFADANWLSIFDSHLTDPDILYAVASDINGYVPTHNSVFSTGDGNPATDRTKRIFNDPIGIAAARNTETTLQQAYLQTGTGATLWDISAPIYVNGEHWGAFRVGVQLAQNQARVQDATFRAVILSSILLVLVAAFAWFLGNYITDPIERLTKASQAAASGDLEARIEIPGRDEITILASAFTQMTTQLRDLIGSLEHRVAARTRDLEIVAEVGTATATILESKRLLQEVVDLTKERFGLYHSHIYLLDEAGENLVLTAGADEPGRIMVAEGRSIPLEREQSLVARAARERKGVTVNDVTQAPDFLPNPLLPDTRSELAVPMLVGQNLIGVFDIQSDQVGRFTETDVSIQTTLAAQLATSIQNVRQFEQSRQRADLESVANVIGQKIQRTGTIEEALQTAVREVGLALAANRVHAKIGLDDVASPAESREN